MKKHYINQKNNEKISTIARLSILLMCNISSCKGFIMKSDSVYSFHTIVGNSVDELVRNGIYHILSEGEFISSRAGVAQQAYNVNYVLTQPTNRLHTTRSGAIKYLAREFIAYFNGSLKAEDGLAKASKFWMSLTDENGNINSNYGFYVFYEPVEKYGTQYNWVKHVLISNKDTRRAIININQSYHKSDTKDFPCTIGIQFYIRDNKLHCETFSRSTDIITGLPYDMGFFSFIHELMWRDLCQSGMVGLELGVTVMRTTFTQIYNKTLQKAHEVIENQLIDVNKERMPLIDSAQETLSDILNCEQKTAIMKWVVSHAK